MASERDADPDASRRSLDERAVEVYAEFLGRHDADREPGERRFAELLDEHPELREELLRIRGGLGVFESLDPKRVLEALQGQHRASSRKIFVRVAAAALLVVTISIASLSWASSRRAAQVSSESRVASEQLSAAVVSRGIRWLEDSVKSESPLDRLAPFAAVGASGGRREPDSLLEESSADAIQGIAGLYRTVDGLAPGPFASVDPAATSPLVVVRSMLVDAEPGNWRKQLLTSIDARRDDALPGKPFLFALQADPQIGALIARAAGDGGMSERLAQLVAQIRTKAVVRLRAVDLDAGGADVAAFRVFVQPILLPSNDVGEPRELSVTPLRPFELDSGDWRITVVDTVGAPPRHSELRLLAQPGEDLGLRVAFLRRTEGVLEGMAYRESATILFGTPPARAPLGSLDLPETSARVEELWIDPHEVTCEAYAAFVHDVFSHPEWFDGAIPIHRPRVLAPDGTCPPHLLQRPIVDVTWNEAALFANWAGKRLPTEREWERVARGTEQENRRYPWGREFDPRRVNGLASLALQIRSGAPRDSKTGVLQLAVQPYESLTGADVDELDFLDGATPDSDGDRVLRLADNVSEFVEDLFVEGMSTSTPSLVSAGAFSRVAKGGTWRFVDELSSSTWSRSSFVTNVGSRLLGFRCVKTSKPGFEVK
jgi:formylglycine-generating enzyme required for sulfatase activity